MRWLSTVMFLSMTKLEQRQRTGRMANLSGLFEAAKVGNTVNMLPRREIDTMASTRYEVKAEMVSGGDVFKVESLSCVRW